MPTIGIIGGNGQVGTEVSLFLSLMPGCRVVPIVRNPIGSAFLRRLGLECRHGDIGSADGGENVLEGCDVVVDMSLPKGTASQITAQIERTTRSLVAHSQPGCRVVYISTIMAFGMLSERRFRRRLIARTVYGATKRFGERLITAVGQRHGRETYILRLGQVHGELQGASRAIVRGLTRGAVEVPAGPSWTVFAYSVAEALVNIGQGLERPGRYTLVSVPEWSWKDVYEYYSRARGIIPSLLEELPAVGSGGWARLRPGLSTLFAGPLMRLAVSHREAIAGHVLRLFPSVEQRALASYGTRRATRSIRVLQQGERHRPFKGTFLGQAPGRRLRSLTDSRATMGPYSDEVRSRLEGFWLGLRDS